MKETREARRVENQKESIAIIGMGCRFPREVNSPDDFWEGLLNGVDGISDIPKSRWDIRKFYDEDINKPGKMYIKQAGFLAQRIEEFDPIFFGISPREAGLIDPMQRLLLEVTWEAFEHAGLTVNDLTRHKTGVFIGGFALDNKAIQLDSLNFKNINANSALGITLALLSNRLSYVFDLTGPSVSFDTACSSSMMALHYAIQSIRNGDCKMAVVGGANVMLTPGYPIAMCKGQFLSHHSRCKAFSADAAGYVRAEGAGVLLIKSLDAAKRDGDNIHAVILESGANQDGGQTNGISLPNPKAQEELIRTVYERAKVSAKDISYIEAHGTGTKAGDPLELSAIANVMEGRDPKRPCLVGSVKTNLGHLEAASAVASVMKAALALKHRIVPPNLHFNTPNPIIPFDDIPLKVPTQISRLPSKSICYAGVNSFGYGGTNGHALLRSPTGNELPPFKFKSEQNRMWLVPVSARSRAALVDLAKRYRDFIVEDLNGENKYVMEDLVYTLGCRRTHHKFRAAFIVTGKSDLARQLDIFAEGKAQRTAIDGQISTSTAQKEINFVLTGMGPQWWKMGRELYHTEPVVKQEMDRMEKEFININGRSILSEMQKDEQSSDMARTEVAQPANFFLQVAIAKLLQSWGIVPNSIVGHSVGEVSAAYLAGALSLHDAVLISHCRSYWQQQCSSQNGGMLAVGLPEADAKKYIAVFSKIEVAAVNSIEAVTMAGDKDQLESLADQLTSKEIFNRFLKVEIAYHSSHMDKIETELKSALSCVQPRKTHTPLYSTVTGKLIDGDALDADYWWSNVRRPVKFAECIENMVNQQSGNFMEIGPHPVLQSSINQCLKSADVQRQVIPTLNRKTPERESMYCALAMLHLAGADIDWKAFSREKPQFLDLPTYPWQREYYWHETDESIERRTGRPGYVYLNESRRGPFPAWEFEVNKFLLPYLDDHQIEGMVVFPGAGYIDIALALHHEIYGEQPCTLENLTIHNMLAVHADQVPVIQSSIDPHSGLFKIHSHDSGQPDSGWKLHASGKILSEQLSFRAPQLAIDDLRAQCDQTFEVEAFYKDMDLRGLNYGYFFRPIRQIMGNGPSIILEIETAPEVASQKGDFVLHPTILDASFQSVAMLIDDERAFVPTSIQRLDLYRAPESRCWSVASLSARSENSLTYNIQLVDDNGNVLADIHQLECRAIAQQSRDRSADDIWLYDYEWKKEKPLDIELSELWSHQLLILATQSELSHDLLHKFDEMAVNYVALYKGSQYAKPQINKITVDPLYEDQLAKALSSVAYLKPTQIIDLWNCMDSSEANGSVETLVQNTMAIRNVLSALERQHYEQNIEWVMVTRGAQALMMEASDQNIAVSPLLGLPPLIVNEFDNILCRTLDLDTIRSRKEIDLLLSEIATQDNETEVAYRQSSRYVRRIRRHEAISETYQQKKIPATDPVKLSLSRNGQGDSIAYAIDVPIDPAEGMVQIQVKAVALDYADGQSAGGNLSSSSVNNYKNIAYNRGREVSGVITAVGKGSEWGVGQQVVALTDYSGFRTYVTVGDEFVMPKPSELSFTQASTCLGYLAAYHALYDLAQIKAGEKVLIHNASGIFGLAAIHLAQKAGAEIFATAETREKRDYLKSIGIKHVMNANNLEFYDHVREATQDGKIEVVLNNKSGEARIKGAQLLKPYGRFIDIATGQPSGQEPFFIIPNQKNLIYISMDLESLLSKRSSHAKELMQKVGDLLTGAKPFPLLMHTFPASETSDAFHMLQQDQHIGGVVLTFEDSMLTVRQPEMPSWLKSGCSYLIFGGTKGFGLALASWMADKGATQLILASRSGDQSEETQDAIRKIEKIGCKVFVRAVDISNKVAVRQLFKEFDLPESPIKGVFHSAAILDDGFFTSLNASQFERVLLPKIQGAWNIHDAENELKHSKLDIFVMFSSISSIAGNRGQANYIVANSFFDNFAFYRRSQGLKALTINWGALAESGMVARSSNVSSILEKQGIKAIGNRQALYQLSKAIESDETQLGIFDVDWNMWFQTNPNSKNSQRYANMFYLMESNSDSGMLPELYEKLIASPEQQRQTILELAVKKEISELLRFPVEKIATDDNITNLGVDSLAVTELSLRLKTQLGMSISSMKLLNSPSIEHLVKNQLSQLFPA